MVTIAKGTWYRQLFEGASTDSYKAAAIASTRTIFVGQTFGGPIIGTIDTADLAEAVPTHTVRSANGSDQLYGCAHIATENVTVAVGNNGRIENSVDQGLNWTSQVVSLSPTLWDVVGVSGDQSRFVAAAWNSIWVQNQSAVWSRNWQATQAWYGVAHLSAVGWVLVGANGYATHSPTALNGTFITPYQITTTHLNKIRANATHYMAVGNLGKVFTSTTGLSGSWTETSTGDTATLVAVAPLASANKWAAADIFGYTYYTDDNGATWAKMAIQISEYGTAALANGGTYALALGKPATIFVSYDQDQADYVEPSDVISPTEVGPAFSENDDMAGDGIRRLITQFRSGRG